MYSGDFFSVVQINTELLNTYRRQLANADFSLIWKEKASAAYLFEDYDYSLAQPDMPLIQMQDESKQPTAVLTIKSVTKARYWPRDLVLNLDQISINSNEDSLTFTNHDFQDIEIYGLTLSVADQSTEISDKESLLFLLPSQGSHQIYLTAIDLNPLALENAQFSSSSNQTNTVNVGAKLVFKHRGSGEMQTLERHTDVPVDLFY